MAAARDPWVAIAANADRRAWARKLARAHEGVVGGREAPAWMRGTVVDSWQRCAAAGVDPSGARAPQALSPEEAEEEWRLSAVSQAEDVIRRVFGDVDPAGKQIVLICDELGNVIWVDGDRDVRETAAEVNLGRGARWSESAAGTNAMGTALAEDHPIQIFSAEHFSSRVHGWTCSAAPIHDPETRDQIGVIDLSGELSTAHPHSLAVVNLAARAVEADLAARRAREHHALVERFGSRVGGSRAGAAVLASSRGTVLRSADPELSRRTIEIDAGGGLVNLGERLLAAEPLAEGGFLLWPTSEGSPRRPRAAIRLSALGVDRGSVVVDGAKIELSKRQTEALVVLSLHPGGLSAEELALQLHGDLGKPATARAEISRLRQVLGPRLRAQPYRLTEQLEADFLELGVLVKAGRVADSLRRYCGPLLPCSEVPAIVEAREYLDYSLREAVIAAADPGLLDRWLRLPSGADDIDACRRLAGLLDRSDPRRSAALSRLRRLSGSGVRP